MRLLINCSNLRIGGGIQVAISFIQECILFNENEYHVFLSPNISSQINQKIYPKNFNFYYIKNSPSSLKYGVRIICQLKNLECKIKPDCVFTVFGPSYWTPKSKHLMGYAIPLYIYPEYFNKVAFSFKERHLTLVKKQFHKFFFKRNADYYYTETAEVSKRLSKFLKIHEKKIFTIGNTFSHVFNNPLVGSDILPLKNDGEFRLLTISAYHIHKNITIINKVIPFLKKTKFNIKFILTLPEDIYKIKFDKNIDSIINLGPVPISLAPYLYSNSDALFLPTLLECFSASYPEAMKMKKPILTSDLSFAHDICGEAAEYFDPLSPEEIANKIINLVNNKDRQKELIQKGDEQLRHFETPGSRAKKLLDACESICKDEIAI